MAKEALEYLEYEVQGYEPDSCNSCREAKARKEAIPKESDKDISIGPNQLIWLDMFTLRKPKNCENVDNITIPNWRLMLDDFTDLSFSAFYDSKDGMVEPTFEQFNLWKKAGKPIVPE